MLQSIADYYTAKVCRHGTTAPGVDWASDLSQRLRFVQLLEVVDDWTRPSSLHDFGCGYGALLDYLVVFHARAPVRYIGTDVSEEMIRRARTLRRSRTLTEPSVFQLAEAAPPAADHAVASGVFNVRLDHPVPAWEDHVASTLAALCTASAKGFAVNFLAPEALLARPDAATYLYGPPAERWLAYGRDVLHCDVRLLAGYGLREYTLLFRRPS
jgi:SAM-dependent methyltransferase